ncbi:MAG: RNA polymerase sigma factor [Bryobacterales bacterium]|nr:RNA polymerase sigma factor [Bryobacterales bacterium]
MQDAEFRTIFEAHQDAVYRFAWRMTGAAGTAEDVAQETFLVLWRAPERYDPARGTVRAFLLGVARNLVLKRWHAEGRWTSLDDSEDAVAPVPPADWQTAEKVGFAVQTLAPLQREAVVLVEYEGLTLEEAARAVGADVGTVKSRLHRARENLRRMLAPLRGGGVQ